MFVTHERLACNTQFCSMLHTFCMTRWNHLDLELIFSGCICPHLSGWYAEGGQIEKGGNPEKLEMEYMFLGDDTVNIYCLIFALCSLLTSNWEHSAGSLSATYLTIQTHPSLAWKFLWNYSTVKQLLDGSRYLDVTFQMIWYFCADAWGTRQYGLSSVKRRLPLHCSNATAQCLHR